MSRNRSTVLITGATGFVGRHLCQHLLSQGFSVKALGRQESFDIADPKLEYICVENYDGNIPWNTILQGVDVVVHLAARVHHVNLKGMKGLALYQETNVKITQQLARASISANVKRFIYVSTIKVNGEQTIDMAFRAEDHPRPQDAYSVSKLQAEHILQEEARRSGMEWVIIRPPLVYGPFVKGNFRRLLKVAARRIPLPFALVKNRRSLVSIYNLCSFIECCVTHPHAQGEIFLVSDNQDLSTPQLVRKLRALFGKRGWLFPFPIGFLKLFGSLVGKRIEIDRLVNSLQVNIEKTERLLSWKPPFSVEAGLEALLQAEGVKRKK
jgi:nucleoside-diphosphate-sugar epimerase